MGVVLCSTTCGHVTGCLDADVGHNAKKIKTKMIKEIPTNMKPNAE